MVGCEVYKHLAPLESEHPFQNWDATRHLFFNPQSQYESRTGGWYSSGKQKLLPALLTFTFVHRAGRARGRQRVRFDQALELF